MPHKDPKARKEYIDAYNAANRDKIKAYHRKWQLSHAGDLRDYKKSHHAKRWEGNRDGMKEANRKAWLARRYGLTPEEHQSLIVAQKNRCAVCGAEASDEKPLHIDHDHATKQVRGLLCGHCNRAMGLFRDDPDIIRKAADYLERVAKGEDL